MKKDLYNDWFCCIGVIDKNTAFYASIYGNDYMEFPMQVAKYIVNRMNENVFKGQHLIDLVMKNRKTHLMTAKADL